MKYVNKYVLLARYVPGLITLAPLSLIYFFLTKENGDYNLVDYFKSLTFVVGVSGIFILTFFISMVVKELGYYLEKKYFKSQLGFPSTYLMLYSDNSLPTQTKDLYGRKIYADFSLTRLNLVQEANNKQEALKVLNQATRLLSTRYQQNEQVKDANIAYGFSRNLSGGLFIAIPSAIIGIAIALYMQYKPLLLWSAICATIYILLAIFHKVWIINNSEKYAEKLFAVYMA
jgi:preprotein translocase subunit SecF